MKCPCLGECVSAQKGKPEVPMEVEGSMRISFCPRHTTRRHNLVQPKSLWLFRRIPAQQETAKVKEIGWGKGEGGGGKQKVRNSNWQGGNLHLIFPGGSSGSLELDCLLRLRASWPGCELLCFGALGAEPGSHTSVPTLSQHSWNYIRFATVSKEHCSYTVGGSG